MLRKFLISIYCFNCLVTLAQQRHSSILDEQITIEFTNVSLPGALRQLNRQANIGFSYNSSIIPKTEKISNTYQNVALRKVLDDLLLNAGLFYREFKGTIIILQNEYSNTTIGGRVVDSETGEPLSFANVFIDNSTIGSATDVDGYFEIDNVPAISFNLVSSYVGYKTKTTVVNHDELEGANDLLIGMDLDALALESIQVVGKSEKKKTRNERRLYRRFEDAFLGQSDNAKDCEIVNPEVLNFERLDDEDNYSVTADDILYVENNALGYRIGYLLEEFRFVNGQKMNIGKAQFKELEPRSRRQNRLWEEAREKAYKGSIQHFLNALILGKLDEEGFKVNVVQYDSVTSEYTTPLNPPKPTEILRLEQQEDEFFYKLTTSSDIEVTYVNEYEDDDYKKQFRSNSKSGNYKYTDKKSRSSIDLGDNQSITSYQVMGYDLSDVDLFQKSIIFFDSKTTLISFPGQFENSRDVRFAGWWNWGSFSDMVPLTYKPPED